MTREYRTAFWHRLLGRSGRRVSPQLEAERLREKYRQSVEATQRWLGLLRELEHEGKTATATYEQYFNAYLQARRLEKRLELEVFNLRSETTSS